MTTLTMISTEAIENMLAKGKRARGRRLGSAVATMADMITASWKKSVHHSQRQVLEHTWVVHQHVATKAAAISPVLARTRAWGCLVPL